MAALLQRRAEELLSAGEQGHPPSGSIDIVAHGSLHEAASADLNARLPRASRLWARVAAALAPGAPEAACTAAGLIANALLRDSPARCAQAAAAQLEVPLVAAIAAAEGRATIAAQALLELARNHPAVAPAARAAGALPVLAAYLNAAPNADYADPDACTSVGYAVAACMHLVDKGAARADAAAAAAALAPALADRMRRSQVLNVRLDAAAALTLMLMPIREQPAALAALDQAAVALAEFIADMAQPEAGSDQRFMTQTAALLMTLMMACRVAGLEDARRVIWKLAAVDGFWPGLAATVKAAAPVSKTLQWRYLLMAFVCMVGHVPPDGLLARAAAGPALLEALCALEATAPRTGHDRTVDEVNTKLFEVARKSLTDQTGSVDGGGGGAAEAVAGGSSSSGGGSGGGAGVAVGAAFAGKRRMAAEGSSGANLACAGDKGARAQGINDARQPARACAGCGKAAPSSERLKTCRGCKGLLDVKYCGVSALAGWEGRSAGGKEGRVPERGRMGGVWPLCACD
jgi:uncharacterized membrane protein YgcG